MEFWVIMGTRYFVKLFRRAGRTRHFARWFLDSQSMLSYLLLV